MPQKLTPSVNSCCAQNIQFILILFSCLKFKCDKELQKQAFVSNFNTSVRHCVRNDSSEMWSVEMLLQVCTPSNEKQICLEFQKFLSEKYFLKAVIDFFFSYRPFLHGFEFTLL